MPRSRRATPKKVRQFAAELPEEFLECRIYGHAWSAHTVAAGKGTFVVTIQCKRCESLADEVLDRTGERTRKRQTHYVPGYLAKGIGRMDGSARSVLRLESVQRQVDGHEADGKG